MFYSQFILAKKGPLGTIWIAAHLERKLRKNQVADTDIGVSVDSILSPDVPIALRLSSHLLLGVVRIYSRKVNYLFDDCSEALLKIKQAFRSAAVDLPPEESKAPYHSITMPETFDLDDFELPDNDILQGNFVDHHISSKEQITLQDTMEGVSYSTSKFGLDERFGDGEGCDLDLEEDLLLDNSRTTESIIQGADDIGTSVALLKQEELSETAVMSSETVVNRVDNHSDLFDYAQAPSTPGLVEGPNLPKTSASGSDEHLESEYHLMECTMVNNANEDKHQADWCSRDSLNADFIPDALNEEGAYKSKLDGEMVHVEDTSLEQKPITEPLGEADVLTEVQSTEDLEKRVFDENKNSDGHIDEEMTLVKSAHEISGMTSSCPVGLDEVSVNGQESRGVEPTHSIGIAEKNFNVSLPQNMETEDYNRDNGVHVHEMEDSTGTPVVRLSSSTKGQPECDAYTDIYAQFDAAVLESSGKEEASKLVGDARAELLDPERLMSAPEGVLIDSTPGELVESMALDDGSKIVSGKKRSFTESTLTEQSLNATESSRLVRFKQSVPDDDDLLSSILAGRSSALKVKTTPRLSEVTSEKRTRSAPRTGGYKRKVLMDETMVLHGDTIRQQLIYTEDIHRVRKKAPGSCAEISMIQRQYLEDAIFLEPVFSGMSTELVNLHSQPCNLSRITVYKSDTDGDDQPMLKSSDIKRDDSSEFAEAPATSQNAENIDVLSIENDDSCRRTTITEQSKDCATSNPLLDGTAPTGTGENASSSKEQLKDLNILEEPLLNTTGLEASLRNDDDDDDDANSSFVLKTGETSEVNPVTPVELDSSAADVFQGEAVNFDDLEGKVSDLNVNNEPKDVNVDDGLQGGQDFENIDYNVQSLMAGDYLLEQHETLSYLVNMGGAEDLASYPHDQDGPEFLPEIDTEFLNLGDDDGEEQNEEAEEPHPDDEDARFAENTGWSSRTRAVSKYLRARFIKEAAETGSKCVSVETLLSGKSRKEASRMFFEALVLKTRDHIHVEQPNPFGDITIKPRARLMKPSI